MNNNMELKAHKILHDIYARMFNRIWNTARNCVEYKKEKPDEVFKEMEHISNPAKWDYCGILSKEDMAVLEVLEYLMNDDQTEIRKHKSWEPIER